ncbi:hypothetical protein ACFL31_04925 [Candidatus Margulisiibacteriota bacterium]
MSRRISRTNLEAIKVRAEGAIASASRPMERSVKHNLGLDSGLSVVTKLTALGSRLLVSCLGGHLLILPKNLSKISQDIDLAYPYSPIITALNQEEIFAFSGYYGKPARIIRLNLEGFSTWDESLPFEYDRPQLEVVNGRFLVYSDMLNNLQVYDAHKNRLLWKKTTHYGLSRFKTNDFAVYTCYRKVEDPKAARLFGALMLEDGSPIWGQPSDLHFGDTDEVVVSNSAVYTKQNLITPAQADDQLLIYAYSAANGELIKTISGISVEGEAHCLLTAAERFLFALISAGDYGRVSPALGIVDMDTNEVVGSLSHGKFLDRDKVPVCDTRRFQTIYPGFIGKRGDNVFATFSFPEIASIASYSLGGKSVAWHQSFPGWLAGNPVLWEDTIYALGSDLESSTVLNALNTKDGSLKWSTTFNGLPGCAAPVIVGERIFVAHGEHISSVLID